MNLMDDVDASIQEYHDLEVVDLRVIMREPFWALENLEFKTKNKNLNFKQQSLR